MACDIERRDLLTIGCKPKCTRTDAIANGRTSRLFTTLCLYRAGYDFKRLFAISEYHDQGRGDFSQAIRADVVTREKQLNERQAKALRIMLENEAMGTSDYTKLRRGVNRRTLQRDMKDMIDKGLVVKEGKTSSLVYRVKA